MFPSLNIQYSYLLQYFIHASNIDGGQQPSEVNQSCSEVEIAEHLQQNEYDRSLDSLGTIDTIQDSKIHLFNPRNKINVLLLHSTFPYRNQ